MVREKLVSVPDWENAIKAIGGDLCRENVFDAAQSLLCWTIFDPPEEGWQCPEERSRIKDAFEEVNKSTSISNLVKIIKSRQFQSLGVHFVDPILGRTSDIWWKRDDSPDLEKSILYSHAWNRIYRRLYRPRATLINAIESGVLSWMKWETVHLRAKTNPVDPKRASLDKFFIDTQELAAELSKWIKEHLPSSIHSITDPSIESVFQAVWNDLEKSTFIPRLTRIATRFRDTLLDNPDSLIALRDYLTQSGGLDTYATLETKLADPAQWEQLLDVIQAIQSSVLSYPEFCNESGLWLHRVDFENPPLLNKTSIFFILGFSKELDGDDDALRHIKDSFGNLGQAINNNLRSIEAPVNEMTSNVTDKLLREIKKPFNMSRVTYMDDGVTRWLEVTQKLAREAKHEGHPINYKIGYGSLAYAQSHFHRYESPPEDLGKNGAPIDSVASYIKGFYSIFGNRNNRGLWFDETGRYCGAFESLNGHFKAAGADESKGQHETTVLIATVRGLNTFDIYRGDDILARVKNGVLVEIAHYNENRNKALTQLVKMEAIPKDYEKVTRWIVNELVDLLQTETHGTSFVVSFEDKLPSSRWRSGIEEQSKTLTRDFSQLKAPLATWPQMESYADGSSNKPTHIFSLLAELANLDGGLWLQISKKGLTVRAAQQFIPLLRLSDEVVRPLDLQMLPELLDKQRKVLSREDLPQNVSDNVRELINLKTLFGAINGQMHLDDTDDKIKNYIGALSFLHHSGTKTHSLWGLSLTAQEKCICVVLSSDGHTYVFHDGREFTRVH